MSRVWSSVLERSKRLLGWTWMSRMAPSSGRSDRKAREDHPGQGTGHVARSGRRTEDPLSSGTVPGDHRSHDAECTAISGRRRQPLLHLRAYRSPTWLVRNRVVHLVDPCTEGLPPSGYASFCIATYAATAGRLLLRPPPSPKTSPTSRSPRPPRSSCFVNPAANGRSVNDRPGPPSW